MTPALPPALRDALADLAALSLVQAYLRLVVAIAPLLVLVLAHAAGAAWSTPIAVVVLLLSLAAAVEPDSHVALVVLAVLGWFWAARVADPASVWSLPAACTVLVFHGTAALSATAPPAATLPRVTLVRWLRRVLAVSAATALLWLLARLAVAAHPAGDAVLTAAALSVMALVALALRRIDRASSPGSADGSGPVGQRPQR